MGRPTYTTPDGQVTRDLILDAATRAFAARGYRGASIDSIAAEVGVSRQGVLHHFPSKVKLLIAVLQRRDDEDGKRWSEILQRTGGSVRDTLQAGKAYRAERHGLAQLYTILSAESVDPDHPAHDYFVERYRTLRALLAGWIEQEQGAGRVTKAIEAHTLASLLVAVLDGLQLQEQLEQDAINFEQALSQALELVASAR